MKFAAINKNDFINGEGVCVSLWVQGCPHHCKGCHNPEQWDFNGGQYKDNDILVEEIIDAITANGIQRNFSVLGGEPFAPQNMPDVYEIIFKVKQKFPNIKVYVWSGYTLEELQEMYSLELLNNVDVLIDGRFILAERDITLKLRGSKNQRILYKGTDF
ncbi:MAG: anaerobic ribonucleoside-triphosphate reductase activating protein [Bacilli bacterium]|nr:anaerobic ribonucleoside-triphosphate reductase activating protein [Bacilli bacterium]